MGTKRVFPLISGSQPWSSLESRGDLNKNTEARAHFPKCRINWPWVEPGQAGIFESFLADAPCKAQVKNHCTALWSVTELLRVRGAGPAISACPGNVWEMQILRPPPRGPQSGSLGEGPPCFGCGLRVTLMHPGWRTTALGPCCCRSTTDTPPLSSRGPLLGVTDMSLITSRRAYWFLKCQGDDVCAKP